MQRLVVISIVGVVLVSAGFWLLRESHRQSDPKSATTAPNSDVPTKPSRTLGPSMVSFTKPQSDALADADQEAFNQWVKRLAEVLSTRDDADSLAAAALLSGWQEAYEQRSAVLAKMWRLLQRASRLAPEDPSIQSLALQICNDIPDCDPSSYERALRSIDSKNAFGWLGAVSRAQKDPDALKVAMTDLAKTDRFDLYWSSNIGRIIRAVESVPISPPLTSRHPADLHDVLAVGVIGMMAAYTLPPFAPIARSCNSDQGLATQCLSVGAAMEHGDTLIVESLGLKIENRITPPGSEEAARIAAALRDLQWQRSALAQMSARSANEWLRIMTESRTEGQALQTWLTQVGVPLQPPSDWSPAPPN